MRIKENGLFSKIGLGDIRLYIHRFTGNDCADLHDHPNDFLSLGVWGQYSEEEWCPKFKRSFTKIYKAPFFRYLKASHTHRISLINEKPVWTIVLMFPKIREWGFFKFIEGKRKWIHWKTYVDMFDGFGAGKDC